MLHQMTRGLITGLIALCVAFSTPDVGLAAIELPINYAQQQSTRLATKLCQSERDCDAAEVTQCARAARSRVDCGVLWTDSSNGSKCSYTVINSLRGTNFREKTTHTICSNGSAGAASSEQRHVDS